MSDLPAGWYDDGSGTQRWWDGSQWTEQTFQATHVEAPADARSSRGFKIGAGLAVAALVIVGGAVGALAVTHTGPFAKSKDAAAIAAACKSYKLSTFAGNGAMSGGMTNANSPGPATSKSLIPYGVAIGGNGTVLLADVDAGPVDAIDTAGNFSPLAHSAMSAVMQKYGSVPSSVATDSAGNVYVGLNPGDGPYSGGVAKIAPDGSVTPFAGTGGGSDSSMTPTAGPALGTFLDPSGLAVDKAGNVYVADYSGLVVKVSTAGELSIIAGNGTRTGSPVEGPALQSPLAPRAVAVDNSGNVYIADAPDPTDGTTPQPAAVVKVSPAGDLSVVAGNGQVGAPTEGPATASAIYPVGLAFDGAGDLYVADQPGGYQATGTGYVDKISPSGALTVIAGSGQLGTAQRQPGGWLNSVPAPVAGPAKASPLMPSGIAVANDGRVYVAEGINGVQTPGNGYVVKLACS